MATAVGGMAVKAITLAPAKAITPAPARGHASNTGGPGASLAIIGPGRITRAVIFNIAPTTVQGRAFITVPIGLTSGPGRGIITAPIARTPGPGRGIIIAPTAR